MEDGDGNGSSGPSCQCISAVDEFEGMSPEEMRMWMLQAASPGMQSLGEVRSIATALHEAEDRAGSSGPEDRRTDSTRGGVGGSAAGGGGGEGGGDEWGVFV